MDNLKFRQYIDGEFWYWGYGVNADPDEFVAPKDPSKPSEQFSGLLDKRSTKIYVGDIVDVPYGKPVNEDGEVAYYKIMQYVPSVMCFDRGRFWAKPLWGKKTFAKNVPKRQQCLWQKEWSIIVGNTSENPELLK